MSSLNWNNLVKAFSVLTLFFFHTVNPHKHLDFLYEYPMTSCIWLWALEICFEVDNILSLASDVSARILSDIQYVCRISFSPWIEMLTFAVNPVSRGRRWSDVPCHSLTPHSIAPRGKLQIFSTFSTTTSFSRTVARVKVDLNRFLLGSFICPGEGGESSALAKFMASGSDSSTPSSLLSRQKVEKRK